jgi:hypothetical protein
VGLGNQSTDQQFPFSGELVFKKLLEVLPLQGYTIKASDALIGRITASAGMSLFSWGENISLAVLKINANSCSLKIDSSLKLGTNISGVHRNQKNIDNIILSLSGILQESKSNSSQPTSQQYVPKYEPVAEMAAEYIIGGMNLTEFKDGTYVLHHADGPVKFSDQRMLDLHLKQHGLI